MSGMDWDALSGPEFLQEFSPQGMTTTPVDTETDVAAWRTAKRAGFMSTKISRFFCLGEPLGRDRIRRGMLLFHDVRLRGARGRLAVFRSCDGLPIELPEEPITLNDGREVLLRMDNRRIPQHPVALNPAYEDPTEVAVPIAELEEHMNAAVLETCRKYVRPAGISLGERIPGDIHQDNAGLAVMSFGCMSTFNTTGRRLQFSHQLAIEWPMYRRKEEGMGARSALGLNDLYTPRLKVSHFKPKAVDTELVTVTLTFNAGGGPETRNFTVTTDSLWPEGGGSDMFTASVAWELADGSIRLVKAAGLQYGVEITELDGTVVIIPSALPDIIFQVMQASDPMSLVRVQFVKAS
jgi:hypothetical protein